MQFVYIVGGRAIREREELRYSIRSVCHHNPDADVVIVGDAPGWFNGKFIAYPDATTHAQINTWAKMREACRSELTAPDFVYMDDDIHLTAPYAASVNYDGTIAMKCEQLASRLGAWPDAVRLSARITPDALNFCTHTPMPINKAEFLRINSGELPKYEAPGLIIKQIYGALAKYDHPQKLVHDVKVMGANVSALQHAAYHYPYFSTSDAFDQDILLSFLAKMFPLKSRFEN